MVLSLNKRQRISLASLQPASYMIRYGAQMFLPVFPGKRPKGYEGYSAMQLTGIHHLTAISAKPRDNLALYTRSARHAAGQDPSIGMTSIRMTVNQDDVGACHCFTPPKRPIPAPA
jgi:glyoxalase family protein